MIVNFDFLDQSDYLDEVIIFKILIHKFLNNLLKKKMKLPN